MMYSFLRSSFCRSFCFILLFLIYGILPAQSVFPVHDTESETTDAGVSVFPDALKISYIEALDAEEAAKPFWVPEETETEQSVSFPPESILLNNDILAYYGHPLSRNMGILGRHSKEELLGMLKTLAAEYEEVNGGRGVKLAFYIIYGTVWPGGEIGIIRESVLKEWIEFALENDMLVFIDHQIGRFSPLDAIKGMFSWLHYPNVHLALDPEWRTDRPMVVIGHVTAEEINEAQRLMQDYIISNNLPGDRMLVIHQFKAIMVLRRERIRADFERIRLIHCMDGIGTITEKLATYEFNSEATNMPIKGFKLFYDLGIPGAGIDRPLMTPKQVMELEPRPYVIMYQ